MALTKASITAIIADRLRSVTPRIRNIDNELLIVLQALSQEGDLLLSDTTGSLVDGTQSYTVPSYCRNILHMNITGYDYWKRIPFVDWQRNIENQSSPTEGDPYQYALHEDKYYPWPVPDASYTVNIHYSKLHAPDTATIEFGDEFNGVLVEGVIEQLWIGVLAEFDPQGVRAMTARQRYNMMVQDHIAEIPVDPVCVRYRDM